MDPGQAANIAFIAFLILSSVSLLAFIYIIFKYEKLAFENPDDASMYRERRRTILRVYLRVMLGAFIVVIILKILEHRGYF